MSKQINLRLACMYDVVLHSNGKHGVIYSIERIRHSSKKWVFTDNFVLLCENNGDTSGLHTGKILDILREGVSIFEPINQNQPHE